MRSEWSNFVGGLWESEINVRDFIQRNYKPYDGDESFLEGPTDATNKLWGRLKELQKEERSKGGVLDMETEVVTSLTAYGAAYIDDELKDSAQEYTLAMFAIIVHGVDAQLTRWEEGVINRAITNVYDMYNVTNDKSTWYRSKGITIREVYDEIKHLVDT